MGIYNVQKREYSLPSPVNGDNDGLKPEHFETEERQTCIRDIESRANQWCKKNQYKRKKTDIETAVTESLEIIQQVSRDANNFDKLRLYLHQKEFGLVNNKRTTFEQSEYIYFYKNLRASVMQHRNDIISSSLHKSIHNGVEKRNESVTQILETPLETKNEESEEPQELQTTIEKEVVPKIEVVPETEEVLETDELLETKEVQETEEVNPVSQALSERIQQRQTIKSDFKAQEDKEDIVTFYPVLIDFIKSLDKEEFKEFAYPVYRKNLQKTLKDISTCEKNDYTYLQIHIYMQNNKVNLYKEILEFMNMLKIVDEM